MLKFIAVIVSIFLSGQTSAFDLDVNDRDKQAHIAATALISGVTYVSLRSQNIDRLTSAVSAMMITMGFAFLKERFVDTTYDVTDMQANFIGSSAGVILPMVFTF